MQKPLETWYTLCEVIHVSEGLNARFVPDHFNADLVYPVVILTLDQPDDLADAESKINRFDSDWLVSIEVAGTTVKLWAEHDVEPVVVRAKSVAVRRGAYTATDLQEILKELTSHLDSCQSHIAKLDAKSKEIEAFVSELFHRADTKRKLTTRTTAAIDAQMEVLKRILSKFRDA